MNFLNNLQINRNQLVNPVIDQRTGTLPSTPVKGQMYYDMDTNDMWYYNGGWVKFGVGGGSVTAVTGADGIQSTGGTAPEIALNFGALGAAAAAVGGDSIAFYDLTTSLHARRTITDFVLDIDGLLNHNLLLNYVADQHVAHTGVTITAGSGLSYSVNGGNIATSSTIDLNINELAVGVIAAGDFVPFWDITAVATNKKVTFANFEGTIDHNNILNNAGNIHIDHTAVTITAGSGLSYSVGGTDISSSSIIDLDINGLTTNATPDGADELAFYDVATSIGNKKLTFANLATYVEGGIDLTFGIAGDSGTGTVSTSQTLTVSGTTNEIVTSATGQAITVGFVTNPSIAGNLTIAGDLTVNGTTTTVNTDSFIVEDPLVKFGNNNAADIVDLGVYWAYTATGVKYGGIVRDASDANDAITFYEGGVTEPTTTVADFGTLADVKFGTVRSGTWNGTAIIDTYISSAATWNAKQDALTFGIANTNAVDIDTPVNAVVSGDYARFTANGLEGRDASEVRGDINVDVAGTDNSTAVTLVTTSHNYLSIVGQAITLGPIDLTAAADVTGILPRANGGTGISTAPGNGQLLIGNVTGGVWAVATVGAGATTGTGAEGTALTWTTGASTLSIAVAYATTALSGVVSLATSAEVITGTSTVLAVVPSALTAWAEQTNYRVTRKYSVAIGTGAATTIDITHGLHASRDMTVEVYRVAAPYDKVYPDIEHLSATQIRFVFSSAPSSGQYQAVVIG